ncbi:MAG: hypothetical protein EBS92_07265, partial [Proteobacteria bacterium]|nr:hypothetical protein [Pseudomonadota bacterium]
AVTEYTTFTYTGDGTTTSYAAVSGLTVHTVLVSVNGITQLPTTNYTISGANVVFVSAPPNTSIIQLRVLGGLIGIQGTTGNTGLQGVQGTIGAQGTTGLAFTVAKVYSSVAALTADTSPTGIISGQFALIDTGNAQDADNSKLYLWNGSSYQYINDLSGTAGIQGITGTQGTQGTTGVQGVQGVQGAGAGLAVSEYTTQLTAILSMVVTLIL